MTTLNADLALPVLERSRPAFANGPRRLDALRMLRISVTDRCNLRCTYCMPAEGLPFEPCSSYLQPEQIESVARVAHALGVTHVKVTGGEPTVRRELVEIVERLASIGFEDVSLTTNALQLVRLAEPLRDAGINRLTISLDSLQPQRYRDITGGGRLELVHAGIDAARRAGFDRLKINMVVMRGVNDDEIEDFAEIGSAIEDPVRTYSTGMRMRLAFSLATRGIDMPVIEFSEDLATWQKLTSDPVFDEHLPAGRVRYRWLLPAPQPTQRYFRIKAVPTAP